MMHGHIFIKVLGFVNHQVNTRDELSVSIYKLNLGTLSLILGFCGTEDIEPGKIRNERRKIMEKVLVECGNGNLIYTNNLGTVTYCFFLWSNL